MQVHNRAYFKKVQRRAGRFLEQMQEHDFDSTKLITRETGLINPFIVNLGNKLVINMSEEFVRKVLEYFLTELSTRDYKNDNELDDFMNHDMEFDRCASMADWFGCNIDERIPFIKQTLIDYNIENDYDLTNYSQLLEATEIGYNVMKAFDELS